ncbi:hypothetical protein LR948_18505 [Roseivivax sp. GX 12232]|uniref:hypothetical protein n=1 Tax=Roseivivax sp. GX 12232 TaxID=2900547 RepID=UPI001E5A666E|nr:hypothetical protein [Roseivivax sp. GX 12232]MCE0507353.1 hypothetical protein [Roseivivax sp. GX 12232]
MSEVSKVFTYQEGDLAYTVTVYCEGGEFFADITVTSGAMDVNALYMADASHEGESESLSGPLNMNGGGGTYQGEEVQWDSAIELSDPGLGREGESKETYLTEGETYSVPLDIDSLDEVEFVGVRATSTSTEGGSIKGVSGEPEEPEDPQDQLYEKVFFADAVSDDGVPSSGIALLSEEPQPNTFGNLFLPEDTEPTFENYVSYFENELNGDITSIETVAFYDIDDAGNLEELFRIDAPEGGFEDSMELLDAYDAALEEMETEDQSASNVTSAEVDGSGSDLLSALISDHAREQEDTEFSEEEADEEATELL